MQVGKLYQVKEYFWMLFPSKENAHDAPDAPHALRPVAVVAYYSDYWSKQLNCNVSYIPQNSIFCLLEENGNYLKVLSTTGELGWIIMDDWAKACIEEVKE